MIIAGVDTETTGLTWGDHRFVELYVGLYDSDTRTKVDEYFTRVNPQRSIAIDAQRIHGISAADVEHSPPFSDVALPFRNMLERGAAAVGHNWFGFDEPFINYELERVKLPKLTVPGIDTMIQGRWATAMGTVPNLGALCWACDISYDTSKAHAAQYDVDVMMECFFKGIDWGWFEYPELVLIAAAA